MVMLMAAQPFAGPAQDGEVSKARGSRLTAHLNIAVSMQGQSRYAGPVRGIRKFDNGFLRFAEHQGIAPQLLKRVPVQSVPTAMRSPSTDSQQIGRAHV